VERGRGLLRLNDRTEDTSRPFQSRLGSLTSVGWNFLFTLISSCGSSHFANAWIHGVTDMSRHKIRSSSKLDKSSRLHRVHTHPFLECHWAMIGACAAWWLIGRFVPFVRTVVGSESHCSHHVGTLGKSFTCSCLWRFGVKLRHSIRAVSGAPLSSSAVEIDWMNVWIRLSRTAHC